ncbi:MAG: hypothetical protein NUW37_20140 [Planctomycetes bacterium]|nr:hypothetical protein [Planctomycetota bacterium]
MNRLPLTILNFILTAAIGACSSAPGDPQIYIGSESMPDSGGSVGGSASSTEGLLSWMITPHNVVSLYIDTGGVALGSYQCLLEFAPEIVSILKADAGEVAEFGPPHMKRDEAAQGRISLQGLCMGESGPRGESHVATLIFSPEGPGETRLKVSNLRAYDLSSRPIRAAQAFLAPALLAVETVQKFQSAMIAEASTAGER